MRKSDCPVCGQLAIGLNRRFNEYTCGHHYWKYSEGRVVVLPPIGETRAMITDFELQKGDGIAVEIIGGDDENGFWLVADEDDLVKMVQIAFDCKAFTVNHLIDALRAACEQAPGGGVGEG